MLDVIADLKPQLNLALGDLSYEAGIEEQFCAMVTGKLGSEFPYQLVTGNHESDGHEGDIENFVKCLPNKLPGMQGEYGTQWYADVPENDPVVRFVMVSPGDRLPRRAARLFQGQRAVALDHRGHRRGKVGRDPLDYRRDARPLLERGPL